MIGEQEMKLKLKGVLGRERVAFNAALNKSLWCKKNQCSVSVPSFSTSSNRCFIVFKAIFKNVSVKSVHTSPVSDISLDVYLGVCCFYRCQHPFGIKLWIIHQTHLICYFTRGFLVQKKKRKKKRLL